MARLGYCPPRGTGGAEAASNWIALSHERASIMALRRRDAAWQPLARYPRFTPWTDDHASILPLLTAR